MAVHYPAWSDVGDLWINNIWQTCAAMKVLDFVKFKDEHSMCNFMLDRVQIISVAVSTVHLRVVCSKSQE